MPFHEKVLFLAVTLSSIHCNLNSANEKGSQYLIFWLWKYRFVFEWKFEGLRFVFVNVEYNITKWKRDRKSIGLYIMAYHQCSQGPFRCRLFYYHPSFVPISFFCYFSIFSRLFKNHFHVFTYLSKPFSLFVQKPFSSQCKKLQFRAQLWSASYFENVHFFHVTGNEWILERWI